MFKQLSLLDQSQVNELKKIADKEVRLSQSITQYTVEQF